LACVNEGVDRRAISAEIIEVTAHIAFVRDTLMAAHAKKST
jgi:hypothetical protein